MIYRNRELLYAEPFADALVDDSEFRSWVLKKTIFADVADEARLLNSEMSAKRSRRAKYWWRSYYTEACRCFGCRGQETDLLAIFEAPVGRRFALHVEVKHPRDHFKKDGTQACAYPVRAKCWTTDPTKLTKVLPHTSATTALLFSNDKRSEYAPHLRHFAAEFTFEDVKRRFPNAVPRDS